MLKFICAGPKPKPELSRFFFHANFDRLKTLTSLYPSAGPDEAKQIINEFTAILRDICVNGVWKVTANGRLPETERAFLRFLATRRFAARDKGVRILDIGASDGITSKNLLDAVRGGTNGPVKILGTDLCTALCRFRRGWVTEYRSRAGHPVLVRVGRLGLRLPESEYRWNWVASAVARWYLRCERFRAGMAEDSQISLINPSADCDPSVDILEQDCLEFVPSMIDSFDAVRASNIISPRYGFEGKKLNRVLTNIHAYLREGGCLVISRNDRFSEVESGSLWTKTADGFAHVDDFGGGAEIKNDVSTFATQRGAACEDIDRSAAPAKARWVALQS